MTPVRLEPAAPRSRSSTLPLSHCAPHMVSSVDPDQTAPIGAVCSGSMLFASILNTAVILGNYLQQTTFSDAFFSMCFKG